MRHRVVIIEPSAAGARIARVATAANEMIEAVVVEKFADVLEHQPTALGYNAMFLDDVTQTPEFSALPAVVWTPQDNAELMKRAAAAEGEGIVAALGWPTYMGAPRGWELLLAFRNALASGPRARRIAPTALDLVARGASMLDWRVSSTAERDETVAQVSRFADAVAGRQSEKIAEVTYELLMNALYDAPVDAQGRFKFAQDRNAVVELMPEESATCRVATDGSTLVVEVVDPFGGLRRSVVLRSLSRVIAAARASAAGAQSALDTSHGGAGLGLHRVFTGAASTIFHVIPKQETRVCASFDLTLSARDLRGMPGSLHFYKGEPT